MAEQEKQEQNKGAGDEAGGAAETATGTGSNNPKGQALQGDEDSQGSSAEQTGEGTGAKAGEYS